MKNSEYRPYKESGFNMIVRITEYTPEDVKKFRDNLSSHGQQVFDRIKDEGKKLSLMALDRMSKEEVEYQKKFIRENSGENYMVGLNDFGNLLAILDQCRLNVDEVLEKTEKLINQK